MQEPRVWNWGNVLHKNERTKGGRPVEYKREDMMPLSPSQPIPQPSDKPLWRSIAYYNCGICKALRANYIVNMPEEEGNGIPIPVCSGCYALTLITETKKEGRSND